MYRHEMGASSPRERTIIGLWPAAAAMAYPFLLDAFHVAVSPPDGILSPIRIASAAILLTVAFVLPLSGLMAAYLQTGAAQLSQANLRACRIAYASIAAPPLFVFVGVAPGLLGLHIPEVALWIAIWMAAGCYVWFGEGTPTPKLPEQPNSALRIAHGVSGAVITCFILFHLSNHLFGLVSPELHAIIMRAGRTVYRAPLVEPLLVMLLLFQVVSGARLAWRWSGFRTDTYRIFQIGSGAYLAAFIITHTNSVLISARAVHKIDTNWAWAAGAPVGLIHDAWNIRLLPHYALGVFFVVGHLASGLRVVIISHGFGPRIANRIWNLGLLIGAALSTAIVAALCGFRI